MKNLKTSVLVLGATMSLLAHPGDALAQGECIALIDGAVGNANIDCFTSIDERAIAYLQVEGSQLMLYTRYDRGQESAQAFLLDGAQNILCRGPRITTRGQTQKIPCLNRGAFIRVVVN